MELRIIQSEGRKVAELVSDKVEVCSVQDALDLMATAYHEDVRQIVIHEAQLCPEFFDLKTKLAGEILQKFANYRLKLAIVGDFTRFESKSLRAFIIECNRGKDLLFLPDVESALARIGP